MAMGWARLVLLVVVMFLGIPQVLCSAVFSGTTMLDTYLLQPSDTKHTIELWVNLQDGTQRQDIVCVGASDWTGLCASVLVGQRLGLVTRNDAEVFTSEASAPSGQWMHMAVTMALTNADTTLAVAIILNGQQIVSQSLNNPLSVQSNTVYVGCSPSSGLRRCFTGKADVVRVWTDVLDEATITQRLRLVVASNAPTLAVQRLYFVENDCAGSASVDLPPIAPVTRQMNVNNANTCVPTPLGDLLDSPWVTAKDGTLGGAFAAYGPKFGGARLGGSRSHMVTAGTPLSTVKGLAWPEWFRYSVWLKKIDQDPSTRVVLATSSGSQLLLTATALEFISEGTTRFLVISTRSEAWLGINVTYSPGSREMEIVVVDATNELERRTVLQTVSRWTPVAPDTVSFISDFSGLLFSHELVDLMSETVVHSLNYTSGSIDQPNLAYYMLKCQQDVANLPRDSFSLTFDLQLDDTADTFVSSVMSRHDKIDGWRILLYRNKLRLVVYSASNSNVVTAPGVLPRGVWLKLELRVRKVCDANTPDIRLLANNVEHVATNFPIGTVQPNQPLFVGYDPEHRGAPPVAGSIANIAIADLTFPESSSGSLKMTVTGARGCLQAPETAAFAAGCGVPGHGELTVVGEHFGVQPCTGATCVTFFPGGDSCSVTSWTDSAVVCTFTLGGTLQRPLRVTIRDVSGDTSTSPEPVVYPMPVRPIVRAVDGCFGATCTDGAKITITGALFGATAEQNTVTLTASDGIGGMRDISTTTGCTITAATNGAIFCTLFGISNVRGQGQLGVVVVVADVQSADNVAIWPSTRPEITAIRGCGNEFGAWSEGCQLTSAQLTLVGRHFAPSNMGPPAAGSTVDPNAPTVVLRDTEDRSIGCGLISYSHDWIVCLVSGDVSSPTWAHVTVIDATGGMSRSGSATVSLGHTKVEDLAGVAGALKHYVINPDGVGRTRPEVVVGIVAPVAIQRIAVSGIRAGSFMINGRSYAGRGFEVRRGGSYATSESMLVLSLADTVPTAASKPVSNFSIVVVDGSVESISDGDIHVFAPVTAEECTFVVDTPLVHQYEILRVREIPTVHLCRRGLDDRPGLSAVLIWSTNATRCTVEKVQGVRRGTCQGLQSAIVSSLATLAVGMYIATPFSDKYVLTSEKSRVNKLLGGNCVNVENILTDWVGGVGQAGSVTSPPSLPCSLEDHGLLVSDLGLTLSNKGGSWDATARVYSEEIIEAYLLVDSGTNISATKSFSTPEFVELVFSGNISTVADVKRIVHNLFGDVVDSPDDVAVLQVVPALNKAVVCSTTNHFMLIALVSSLVTRTSDATTLAEKRRLFDGGILQVGFLSGRSQVTAEVVPVLPGQSCVTAAVPADEGPPFKELFIAAAVIISIGFIAFFGLIFYMSVVQRELETLKLQVKSNTYVADYGTGGGFPAGMGAPPRPGDGQHVRTGNTPPPPLSLGLDHSIASSGDPPEPKQSAGSAAVSPHIPILGSEMARLPTPDIVHVPELDGDRSHRYESNGNVPVAGQELKPKTSRPLYVAPEEGGLDIDEGSASDSDSEIGYV